MVEKGKQATAEAEARAEALERARAKLRARLRELDSALQASSNIGTRYDIKVRIEELAHAIELI